MTESTMTAYHEFFELKSDIEIGTKKESELRPLFKKLSKLDYRNTHEVKIDAYVWFFKNAKGDKNIKVVIEGFLKEHFKYVRIPFWAKYKLMCEGGEFFSPSRLLFYVKQVEREMKK